VLWFLVECSSVVLISLLFALLFVGSDLYFFFYKLTFISFLSVSVHRTVPPFRNDQLMCLFGGDFYLFH